MNMVYHSALINTLGLREHNTSRNKHRASPRTRRSWAVSFEVDDNKSSRLYSEY